MISLRLLTVLNVEFKYAPLFRKLGAERRTACTDGPLRHLASPPHEKNRLEVWRRVPDSTFFRTTVRGSPYGA